MIAGVLLAAQPRAGTIAEYDVRYGPLRLLSLSATVSFDGSRYRAESQMQTTGVVGVLFPWTAHGSSEGVLDAHRLQPSRHVGNGEFRGERRSVIIDYAHGGGVSAVVEPPPERDSRQPVPLDLQQQTIDPLTASIAAITFPCGGTLKVFDGRRRYDMRLLDLGASDVPDSGYGAYRGSARRCRAQIQPLAGFWPATPQHDERPTQIDYWIATPQPELPPVPVYLELSGARGTLAIHLQKLAAAAPDRR
jgi:hypothetical protein